MLLVAAAHLLPAVIDRFVGQGEVVVAVHLLFRAGVSVLELVACVEGGNRDRLLADGAEAAAKEKDHQKAEKKARLPECHAVIFQTEIVKPEIDPEGVGHHASHREGKEQHGEEVTHAGDRGFIREGDVEKIADHGAERFLVTAFEVIFFFEKHEQKQADQIAHHGDRGNNDLDENNEKVAVIAYLGHDQSQNELKENKESAVKERRSAHAFHHGRKGKDQREADDALYRGDNEKQK